MTRFLIAIYLISGALRAHSYSVNSSFRHLVCQQCDSWCPNERAFTSRTTMIGKAGPRGPKGPRGFPGIVNMTAVEDMVDAKIETAIEAQRRNITDLSSALLEANEKIGDLLNKTDYCPIQYDGKCFWVEARYGRITFEQAKAICKAKGATPANIYSEEHHYMMMGYVRPFGSRDGNIFVWTGMTHNFETTTTYHYDGVTEASFTRWYPNYPRRIYCCNIALYTRMDWNDKSQHLYTYRPTFGAYGVLCEKVFH